MTEAKYQIGQQVTVDGRPGRIVGLECGRHLRPGAVQGVNFNGWLYYVSFGDGERWTAVPETGISAATSWLAYRIT